MMSAYCAGLLLVDGEDHRCAILIEFAVSVTEILVHLVKDVQELIEGDIVTADEDFVDVTFVDDVELGRCVTRHDVGQDGGGCCGHVVCFVCVCFVSRMLCCSVHCTNIVVCIESIARIVEFNIC